MDGFEEEKNEKNRKKQIGKKMKPSSLESMNPLRANKPIKFTPSSFTLIFQKKKLPKLNKVLGLGCRDIILLVIRNDNYELWNVDCRAHNCFYSMFNIYNSD